MTRTRLLTDPTLREKVLTMTPEDLRARLSPATMRRVRGYQVRAALFLLLLLVCLALGAVEIVTLFRVVLVPSTTPLPGIFTTSQLMILGSAVLANMGISWCRSKTTLLIDEALEQSLNEDVEKN